MDHQPETPETNSGDPKHLRVYGLVMALIGTVMVWYFIFNPLAMAADGAEEITIHRKFAMIGMALCGFGSLLAILGKKAVKMLPDRDANLSDVPLVCWVTLITLSGIGIYVWFWFEAQMTQLGYQ